MSYKSKFLVMSCCNYKVAIEEALRFMIDCLVAAGANCKAAQAQANLLIQADINGHPSHGMNRLEMYINDIKSGACKPNNTPEILSQTMSTAWIDAKNVMGATVSHMAMDLAICKAYNTGIGWVVVKESNHNGIAGFWAQKAAVKGLIGLAFTNTAPILAPTRSKEAALGTNPIAVAAFGSNCESFYLDMSTSTVALGKIDIHRQKGQPIPPGWAQGPDGKETVNAKIAYNTKRLYPLGGEEKTSGYKGYGLAAMVELLCGITAGSNYGKHIPPWTHESTGKPANLAHCFGAINPQCFAPGFEDRLCDCIRQWRTLNPLNPNYPVLAPGDKEVMASYIASRTGVVPILQSQINTFECLAKRLKVTPICIVGKK